MATDEEKNESFHIEGKYIAGLSGFTVTLKIGHDVKMGALYAALKEIQDSLVVRMGAAMKAKGYGGENMPGQDITSTFTFGDLAAFEKSNSVATPRGLIMGKGGMA